MLSRRSVARGCIFSSDRCRTLTTVQDVHHLSQSSVSLILFVQGSLLISIERSSIDLSRIQDGRLQQSACTFQTMETALVIAEHLFQLVIRFISLLAFAIDVYRPFLFKQKKGSATPRGSQILGRLPPAHDQSPSLFAKAVNKGTVAAYLGACCGATQAGEGKGQPHGRQAADEGALWFDDQRAHSSSMKVEKQPSFGQGQKGTFGCAFQQASC